ncbi:MAG: hypothetical protein QOE06_3590 [Thermoleophilaceae bacterium]|nr:hypothetical protein [Thermoleophilaceae bacterium]
MIASIPHLRARLLAAALAAGALLAAGLPAHAAAQSPDEICQGVQPAPGVCAGLTKLAERAAAECRRAGLVADESCTGPMGHRVIRSEVKTYESSWLHRTLGFQYALGNAVPLRDAPWLGTHNSFNSTSEDPTASHTDSNQQLTLSEQLRIDIRSLELDVHWFPSARAGGAYAPVVCHAQGASQMHAGCTTERLLSERLTEIDSWLRAHADQVLLLYVEDNVDTAEGYDPTSQALADGLRGADGKSLIYKPPSGGGCSALPLNVTRDDVLRAGRQVVIVSGCGQGAAWHGLVFNWGPVEVEERNHGYRDAPVCDQDPEGDGQPAFGRDVYASKVVRYFEDSTWLTQVASNVGQSTRDDGIGPDAARRMTRCGVDLLGFDQILPNDGRLDAVAWSWAPDEPSRAGTCTIQRGDGRWIARRCNKRQQAACRRADGRWIVTLASVTADAATAACRQLSAKPTAPRTGAQNEALRDAARAAGASGVWLPVDA